MTPQDREAIRALHRKWHRYRHEPRRMLSGVRYDELDERRDNALLDAFIADLDTLLSSLTASTPKVDPLPAKYVDGVRVDSLGLPTELQSIELLLNDAEPVRPYAWKQAALRLRDATVEHVTELQAALDTERAMHAAWRKRAEEAEAAASAPAEAHGYLSRLLTSYAPQCEPLPDLLGVCTQIDNLMTGACMKPKGHEWGETRPRPPIVIESQDDAPSAPAADGKAQEP
jgi:hypothetical protein